MTLGVVYCALSESYPGRCKIGKTFRNAGTRIAELQRHYKSHRPFTEHASMLVEHYGKVEWLAHRRLGHCREPATEMFVCTPDEAMAAIHWAVEEALRHPPQHQPRPQRAPKRWRRAGHLFAERLIFWVTVLLMLAGLALVYASAPDWLPASTQRAIASIKYWL